jgi:hypothetical protein
MKVLALDMALLIAFFAVICNDFTIVIIGKIILGVKIPEATAFGKSFIKFLLIWMSTLTPLGINGAQEGLSA